MFFPRFFKVFYSQEFKSFERSQLEFRKEILKILQYSLSIFVILFMAIVFPNLKLNLFYYVFLPSFLVTNHAIICIITRQKYQHLCPKYLFLLQLLLQIIGLELGSSNSQNISSKRALIMGIQAGLLQTIGFLHLSSSLLNLTSSFVVFIQLLIRLIMNEGENLYTSLLVIITILILVNFVGYRYEMLNFSVWNSYVKSTNGLMHFQKLIDIFPSQITVVNEKSFEDDKPLYFNQEAEKLKEAVFGNTHVGIRAFLDLFRIEDDNYEEHDVFRKLRQAKTLKTYVEKLLRKSHLTKEFQKIASEFRGFKWEIKYGWIEWNSKMALILIFNDISKNEKISVLENFDKNKDRVLATVSHEFRTPLNAVIGLIDVAYEEIPESNASIKNYLRIAKESANSLSHMINNILDLELLRKGKLCLNLKRTRLIDTLENVLPLATVLARKKNLEFIFHNECQDDIVLFVDPFRLQQILMNLLDNAAKFTTLGFIKLRIKRKIDGESKEKCLIEREQNKKKFFDFNLPLMNIENNNYPEDEYDYLYDSINEEQGESNIKISVEDSGLGITEEKKKSLFQLFGKVENNLTVRGMGLGLALSQSLALKMGSTGIILKSKPGHGSKFSFILKANLNKNQEKILRKIPEEGKKSIGFLEFPSPNELSNIGHCKLHGNTEKFKILIVDDDEVNHLVISLYIKSFKSFVSTDKVYNGKQALDLIFQNAKNNIYYDLILMDCDMPVMNGFEATSTLKESVNNGRIPDIKVIALTANASNTNKECCINHGMIDVWNKPISKNEFLKRLGCLLPSKLAQKFELLQDR